MTILKPNEIQDILDRIPKIERIEESIVTERKGKSAPVVKITKEHSTITEEDLEYIELRYNLKLKYFYWEYGKLHMFFKREDVQHKEKFV